MLTLQIYNDIFSSMMKNINARKYFLVALLSKLFIFYTKVVLQIVSRFRLSQQIVINCQFY